MASPPAGEALELPRIARVAVVGDGLAAGMEETGWFERMLRSAFPGRELELRYFHARGATAERPWPGRDAEREQAERALRDFAPHLVIYGSGRNDAAAGPAGVERFRAALTERLRSWKGAVKVVVLGPVVFPGAPLWQNRQDYAAAMREVCAQVPPARFLDLAPALAQLREGGSPPLSWNGVELNPLGHWHLARLAAAELGWEKRESGADGGAPSPHEPVLAGQAAVEARAEEGDRDWTPPEAPPRLSVTEGCEISLWASAVEMPFGGAEMMDFDAQGRLLLLSRGGRLVRLEDLDRNLRADRHDLFAELPVEAAGLAAAPEGVWVGWEGGLARLRDGDGDGRADGMDRFLSRAFRGASGCGPGQLTWGAAGDLWFTLDSGQPVRWETARGVLETGAGPGLFRFIPARGEVERVAAWKDGQACLSAGARDGLFLTREAGGESYCLEQMAWFTSGAAGDPLARAGAPVKATATWWLTGPPGWKAADHLVCAVTGPQGSLLWFREAPGRLPGWNALGYLVQPVAGFSPLALSIGPDGALYVLDRGTGQSGEERIWRIASTRSGCHWGPATVDRPAAELLQALREEAPLHRRRLRQELWRRPAGELEAVRQPDAGEAFPDEQSRPEPASRDLLHWQIALGRVDEELLRRVSGGDVQDRVAGVRACAEWFPQLARGGEWLRAFLDDEAPAVRLAALESARKLGTAEAISWTRLAGDAPLPGLLEAVFQATGGAKAAAAAAVPVPGLAATARALPTEQLAAASASLSPQAAAALWEREDVPPEALLRAGQVLASRRGLSFTGFLFDLLEDRWALLPEWRHVQALISHADGGELHVAVPRLRSATESAPSQEARRAAWAALILSTAAGGTLRPLIQETEEKGDEAMAALLGGALLVAKHSAARSSLKDWLSEELHRSIPQAAGRPSAASRERRDAALALDAALTDVPPVPEKKRP